MSKYQSAAIVAAVALSIPIFANAIPAPAADAGYGAQVQDPAPDKQIVITPDTKWANVTDGQTVRFVVKTADGHDQSFTYHFQAFVGGWDAVDLSKIAPSNIVLTRPIEVYIEPDDSERG